MKTYILVIGILFFALGTANSQELVASWPSSGSFAGGLEYDNATNTVWVVDATDDMVFQYSRIGALLTSFPDPDADAIGIGVCQLTGMLWIGSQTENMYQVDPLGAVISSWSTKPSINDVSGVAVDPITGNIYVSQDSAPHRIVEFDQLGNTIQIIDLTNSGSTDADGLGYNPITRTFYLGEDTNDLILEVDMSGNLVKSWDMSGLGISPEAVGVDIATGALFIGDGSITNSVFEVSGIITLISDTLIIKKTGGVANFTLAATTANANRKYILLGGISGALPGTPLPGGLAVLPINMDIFTNVVMAYLNTTLFDKFLGNLDAQGKATATLTIPSAAGLVGLKFYFAYALNNPWDFVSSTACIEIVH